MRDVHDGLGGLLIQAIGLVEQEDCSPALRDVLSLALTDLRLIVDSLSPTDAKLASLLANFRHLHGRIHMNRGCRYSWQIDDIVDVNVTPTRSLSILRILQEALTNVSKHANATHVQIAVCQMNPATLYLSVKDDGVGLGDASHSTVGQGLGQHAKSCT